MRNITFLFVSLFCSIIFAPFELVAQHRIIWELGKADNSGQEFALAPDQYQAFLENDFGWEDRSYFIDHSELKKDFPYVLPGASDYWGGTSVMSGIRPHEINLYFALTEVEPEEGYLLYLDLVDVSPDKAPLLKIEVNGKASKFPLSEGKSKDALKGTILPDSEQVVEVDIKGTDLRTGGNHVKITILQGSWLLFDYLALKGGRDTELKTSEGIFLKKVAPADYELEHEKSKVQPLLVDLFHLEGTPELKVVLDGDTIFTTMIDHGRKILEVPMPAVLKDTRSLYQIYVDDLLIQENEVMRSPNTFRNLAGYVDTKIGTGHSRWMIAPGPWMPFSMVKISPDNQDWGWQSGYEPTFESVGTFSHIHEWTMSGLGTFPTNGPLITDIGKQGLPDSGYRSRIDKQSEKAPLGYYAVNLSDYNIQAELTATTRCSFQRYTFPDDRKGSRVLIDLKTPAEYGFDLEKVLFKKVSDTQIVGYSQQVAKSIWGERYYRKQMVEGGDEPRIWDDIKQEYKVHFIIEFDQPISEFKVMSRENKEDPLSSKELTNGRSIELMNPSKALGVVSFDTSSETVVQMRTGISYVSIENAEKNLETEIRQPFGWQFEEIRKQQIAVWNKLFERVQITTSDQREKVRFYSNMYRALVSRNTFSDVDGKWMDAEENIQQFEDPDDLALGCDAFWNTFWNLNQFWNLVTPDWSSKWVKSQLAMYRANGWLAKGPAGMEYIPVMVAEHEIPLIVSAYQMGIDDFDTSLALEAIIKMQTTEGQQVGNGYAGNRDLPTYLEHGYVPYNRGRFSNTLEYSFDDFAVSQMAFALDQQNQYEVFKKRSNNWKNAIDVETGFARLRHSDGTWYEDFDPIKTGGNHQYVEGNAWQLTFFVPHDITGLAELVGAKTLSDRLNDGFELSSNWRYNAPNELYWDFPVIQGNQQSMHFAYLFNWFEKPWLTQKWVRDICERYYGYGISNAYLGDEDQGQMSGWFIMSAIGLFQTDGGTRVDPIYEIGSPLFERIEIDLGNRYGRGETFVIETINNSHANRYIQSATLNGKELTDFYFPASELLQGGKLELVMGDQPNKNWGK